MFLKQLYKYNRWYFFLVILFISGQLLVNFKRGAVFSPFFHFGMYSQVMDPQNQYTVFEVVVDGKMLQGKDFNPWEWDKLFQPLVYFVSIPNSNSLYKNEVQRVFSKFSIRANEKRFVQQCNYDQFMAWYKSYLSGILPEPASTVQVNMRTYQYSHQLMPTQSVYPLKELCR